MRSASATLDFVYDGIERLIEVNEVTGATTSRPLKVLTYGAANQGTNKRLGRLETATRYNYVDLATLIGQEDWHEYQVVETYTYAGLGGRLSAHWTDLFIDDVAQTRFVSSQSWNPLGEVVESIHPRCVGCDTRPGMTTTREVDLTYSYGLLTGLDTIAFAYTESTPDSDAWTFSYHPTGQLSQIAFPSALLETWTLDPTGPSRPGKIEVKDGIGATLWTSGDYRYDGAGNITEMGGSWFRYDGVSRLVEARVTTDPWSSTGLLAQTYSFDAFGNLQGISGASGHATPTSNVSNRLTSAGYDNRGNLTTWLSTTYRYDALGSMWRTTAGTEDWVYVYDADGERVLEKKLGGDLYHRWTLRGAGSQVQRIYTETGTGHLWQVEKDYLYRGDKPLWSAGSGQSRALHTDHLGTPRLLTDHTGAVAAFHTYFPFGEEATSPFQDSERMKFTGHERDLGDPGSTGDDLDYMHARFCSPVTGRFMAVDPINSAKPGVPQSWNKYSYTWGNPLRYVDRDGQEIGDFSTPPSERSQPVWGSGTGYLPPRTPGERLSDVTLTAAALYGAAGAAAATTEASLLLAARHPTLYFAAFKLLASFTDAPAARITIPGPTNSALGKLDYLLGLVPGNKDSLGKGGTFASALGFTRDTLGGALKAHLLDNLKSAEIAGNRITVVADLTGPSGQTRGVRSVWQILKDGTIALVTAFEDSKK
ncbi:MAG TPA: RHS repeat-associated core domain-containing protein [Thermoanaerobaculia bacterium]|nr:RHS repeat-associated core domain-containing protein [Thermoanaerobaculia bacterium]